MLIHSINGFSERLYCLLLIVLPGVDIILDDLLRAGVGVGVGDALGLQETVRVT